MQRKKEDFVIVVLKRGVVLLVGGLIVGIVLALFNLFMDTTKYSLPSPGIETAQASILPSFHKKQKPKKLTITTHPQQVEVTKVNADNSLVVKGENTTPCKVKLLMISFPPANCYGSRKAHQALKSMTLHKTFWVFTDNQAQSSNEVYLQHGKTLVQIQLLQQGNVIMQNYNGSEKYFYNLQKAQDKASADVKGVWLIPGYVTTTGYHKKAGLIDGEN